MSSEAAARPGASAPVVVFEAGRRPGLGHSLDPRALLRQMLAQRSLIAQFTWREIEGRYRGSFLGLFWTLIHPLVLLITYTLVFGGLFKARWPDAKDDGLGEFALALFCGLTAYNLLSECVQRAPRIVVGVPNYVRKVVFPLEILPVSVLGSAVFHALASLGILGLVRLVLGGGLPWTILLLPVVSLPLVFLSLGLTWFLAGLGVYVRDIGQFAALALQVLMFATPIFYPPTLIPENLRPLLLLNPLSDVVENWRRVVLWGRLPEWGPLGAWTLIGAFVLMLGYAWFTNTKRGFADVL